MCGKLGAHAWDGRVGHEGAGTVDVCTRMCTQADAHFCHGCPGELPPSAQQEPQKSRYAGAHPARGRPAVAPTEPLLAGPHADPLSLTSPPGQPSQGP